MNNTDKLMKIIMNKKKKRKEKQNSRNYENTNSSKYVPIWLQRVKELFKTSKNIKKNKTKNKNNNNKNNTRVNSSW